MNACEFVQQVQKKDIDVVEHTQKVLEECRQINKEHSYFNFISEELALEQAKKLAKKPKGALAGLAISIKDAICVKGIESTAGSRILSSYKPTFNATCVQRLIDQGALIIGKTAQDEFGFGSFSVNVGLGFKIPLNPFDKKRSCGGSSGGSAGLTQKASFPHISLGESTGGSIAEPASFCGVFGLCPTYGRVSRYGLIDYSNSMDKIGPIGKSMADIALALKLIAGFDPNESTTINVPVEDYTNFIGKDIKGLKLGIIKEAFGQGIDKAVADNVWKGIKKLESLGAQCEEISIGSPIKYGIPTYYLLAATEASTNLAKFCGMRYGAHEKLEGGFNQYFAKVRSANFGQEAKRRIMIGTFARMAGFREAYYLKAAKVRTKIIADYKSAFKRFDVLVSPTVPILPPTFDEIKKLSPLQNYMTDVLTVSPNVAGLPHLNVPAGFEKGLPIGMLLTADHLQENKLVQLGSALK